MKYPTTSKTLLGKLQKGDAISWHEFYNKYKGIVFAAGKFKGLSDSECEDLMQEVMLRFFKNSRTFVFDSSIARFRTYFGKIITGKIYDIIKCRKQNISIDELDLQNVVLSEDELEEKFCEEWQKLILAEAEARLKEKVDTKTFMAYQLFAVQNRPLKEISIALNQTPNQIYLAKSRCLKHLRGLVKELERSDDCEVSSNEI